MLEEGVNDRQRSCAVLCLAATSRTYMFVKEVHTCDICGFHGLFGSLSTYIEQIIR
jgi:hypothetical protein